MASGEPKSCGRSGLMEIKTVGVVGCGVMGSGITQTCAQFGYNVVVCDLTSDRLDRGLARVNSSLAKAVEKGSMLEEEKVSIVGRIKKTMDVEAFSKCDIVIEAVTEDLEIKKKVFAQLDGICPPNVILASNTSSLSIIDMAAMTGRPDKVLGIHFNQPAPVMKLLELVKSIETSEESIKISMEFGRSLGKTVIVAPDVPGFIAARLITPYLLNAVRMLENGIGTREEIDDAAKFGFNHPMGPLALIDFIGLDVEYNIAKFMYEELKDPQYAPPILLKKLTTAGHLGRKTGKGFFEYK
jgi:3-hydroxybutyryl-CoA dehydrogenase